MSTRQESEPREWQTVEIRITGLVQGVGFRPAVWRFAREANLTGWVRNDGAGVLITASGNYKELQAFLDRIEHEPPPLSKIESIETRPLQVSEFDGFHIVESRLDESRTRVAPDAATCFDCRDEVLNPAERRFRYPFTNCTNCGPRFSIVQRVPYDRSHTTMADFAMCSACSAEYSNPADRRFHAQPIACPVCGPRVWLEPFDSSPVNPDEDAMTSAVRLLQAGRIVAIRGLGGFHLACDATNPDSVKQLRHRKQRFGKPFALMAQNVDKIRKYCDVDALEASLLESPEAPIVLLPIRDSSLPTRQSRNQMYDGLPVRREVQFDGQDVRRTRCAKNECISRTKGLPHELAPGLDMLGFMLPYTPLHLLLLQDFEGPLVMTSGNISDEPQLTSNEVARDRLRCIADAALMHDREIANRIDDSVVRVMAGEPRLIRRARGYAPNAIAMPPGFENAPDLLAFGGQLKSTFCLLKDGSAILSPHQGDLEELATFDDYRRNLDLFADIYDHRPALLVADLHPDYASTKLAEETSQSKSLPLVQVQHHHAHIASCLAENGVPLDAPPVLGIALDGAGLGDDGTIWGGEFLVADYVSYERVAMFQPVAMPGGEQAIREPWRNTYAHLISAIGWDAFEHRFGSTELCRFLKSKPLETLDRMLARNVNVPVASSCGRLFDAVAAALGFCRDESSFEGQGAMELEASANRAATDQAAQVPYPFAVDRRPVSGQLVINPTEMWLSLLADLARDCSVSVMAARFHKGLARVIRDVVRLVNHDRETSTSSDQPITRIALSGGCFQNRLLLEGVTQGLAEVGFDCLLHARIPANDGGLALGQAAIGAARTVCGAASLIGS